MTGIIFDIKRFAVHDGPGIRTTVFLKGCPLACAWCHNPESKEEGMTKIERCYRIEEKTKTVSEVVGKKYSPEELRNELLKDIQVMDESEGGVTFSGGEPLFQFEFLKNILKLLKNEGVHTCIDTSGFTNGFGIDEIIPFTDLYLYDLKHYDETKHKEITGVSLIPILKNLSVLTDKAKEVWLRIPIIPGVNDSHEDKYGFLFTLQKLKKKPAKIQLLPYHAVAESKYERLHSENKFKNVPSTDPEKLKPFKNMLERSGYNAEIGA